MADLTLTIDDQLPLGRDEWGLLVKLRTNWTCERCGVEAVVCGKARVPRLHSHHINHDETDHRLVNGECLCAGCHSAHHRKTRSAFKDPTVQRELSRRSVAKVPMDVRLERAWMTWKANATPEQQAARTRARVEAAAAQSGTAKRERALKGWATRHPTGPPTHCKRGHLFDAVNTYIDSEGFRNCRECRREAHLRRSGARRSSDRSQI
jgi:hypothetical protein